MKKKIIKSYFFKQDKKISSVHNIFSFSKRAVKQKKQLTSIIARNKGRFNKRFLYRYNNNVFLYKSYDLLFKQIQWNNPKFHMKQLFCKSYYTTTNILKRFQPRKNLLKKNLAMWLSFKNRFNKSWNRKLRRFPKLGILSSHFVHFVSKKNITYQNRSKYKAKIYNMNTIYSYIYLYTLFICNFLHSINTQLYFFTKNISKRSNFVNDDFLGERINWFPILSSQNVIRNDISTLPTNISDYTNVDYNQLYTNKDAIKQYLNESDLTKKELLYNHLAITLTPKTFEIISIAQQFFTANIFNGVSLGVSKLSFFTQFYCDF